MSEEVYSDDFSREEPKGQKIFIDEEVEIEGDKDMEREVNRATSDTNKLKKPYDYGQENQDPNVFVASRPFKFQEPDRHTHWKTIDKVDVRNIIGGDIQQLNTVMNELAFSNFNDPAFVKPTKEGRNALQIMQYSLQYFMFTQSEMVSRINTLHKYIEQGKSQLTQIKKVEKTQKEKIKKQKKADRKLNEQAMHYEFLIKRFRPDLDPEKLESLHKDMNL